ncbi:M15 family metallopeptidase [Tropicibacter oceani]|uniref:M15 family metallopeptidase n=1 Tax=Tropicibacter oceani TaxID=3058420 RepID=A0ABY8QCR0_9RHOB|nr:M15 family metallopeptidase [Tropicibacter oceani]WGW02274.1 M15 family metallopeptidase [Tropicibacter oceani]
MRSMVRSIILFLFVAGPLWAQDLRGTQAPIPDAVWARMDGVSWHAGMGCPGREALRLLSIPHLDFQGQGAVGEMIVAADVAEDVLDIFADLHAAGFQIELMRPVHLFMGDDGRSMAANNTSAFNCRVVGGTNRLSQHAFGKAMDINPVQNPYVKGGYTSPEAGKSFDGADERTGDVPGIVLPDGPVTRAFKARGWGWGGDWSSSRDYQHFSQNGR